MNYLLEAVEEKRYLKARRSCSLILIPLIIKGESWGYMGIDIVDKYRMWSLEDYNDCRLFPISLV